MLCTARCDGDERPACIVNPGELRKCSHGYSSGICLQRLRTAHGSLSCSAGFSTTGRCMEIPAGGGGREDRSSERRSGSSSPGRHATGAGPFVRRNERAGLSRPVTEGAVPPTGTEATPVLTIQAPQRDCHSSSNTPTTGENNALSSACQAARREPTGTDQSIRDSLLRLAGPYLLPRFSYVQFVFPAELGLGKGFHTQ